MPVQNVASSGISEALVASGARTTSGDSGILPGWGAATRAAFQLHVTAAAGTGPTLDVVIEDTLDGTNWNVIATFAQKTGASREVIRLTTAFADRLRVRWTIGGVTPSFTFAVHAYSEA